MRVLVSAMLLVLASGTLAAKCPCTKRLLGTWQSDREQTMAYNEANAKLSRKQTRFMAELLGTLTLTYTKSDVVVRMPDSWVTGRDGKKKPFAAFEDRSKYEIVHCDPYMVITRTVLVTDATDDADSDPLVNVLNMVDDEHYWVYQGQTDPTRPDLHSREYFKKVR
ncbi:hypothetical protein C7S18_20805 [Ahniella affigens]|uniref:Uncharacterized protein n=1 Tax=Ahniella affigens TaxID=2021234 RepID=A0A2P1PX85_9GAMM|nr:hypothetical protein [Ahniella affigens]AVP99459.1 hypothetical protein C7S18_20805 [Ahniella affigens]